MIVAWVDMRMACVDMKMAWVDMIVSWKNKRGSGRLIYAESRRRGLRRR